MSNQPPPVATAFAAAVAHHQAGRLAEAEAIYREILSRAPNHVDSLHLSGVAAGQGGRYDEALALVGRAVALNDRSGTIHHNFAEILRAVGRLEQAAHHYRQAVALLPGWAEAHNHLGVVLQELGLWDQAVTCYRRALVLDDGSAASHNNLGVALQDRGALAEAEACYRRALALDPDFADAAGNLGNLLREQGRLDDAVELYHRVLAIWPQRADVRSNLLFTLMCRPDVDLPDLAAAAAGWEACHAAGFQAGWPEHRPGPRSPRTPRLGFVSADFRRHAVGFLVIGALEALTAAGHELVCYSNGAIEDALTARIRALSTWRTILGRDDRSVAEQIRADGIDILFDLSGHTAGNRLPLFARKPAPLQVAWVGYPGTTGLAAMDYLLADRHQVPEGADAWYRERIIRLPHSYVCWEPPAEAPPVTGLPAATDGPMTFGSFNFLSKLTPQVIAIWSRILQQVPESRLLLKAVGFACPLTRNRCRALFGDHGIPARRLVFAGGTSRADHLAAIGSVDIALDTFPYNGGLTTLETLWMGVPVITCPGRTVASRHSFGYLTTLGLGDLIAADPDGAIRLAVAWAGDRNRLAGIRAGLRARMLASPLCDAPAFARDFAAACRLAWDGFCAGQPPAPIRPESISA